MNKANLDYETRSADCSKNSPTLVFITTTGGGKKSKEAQTQIRKHVMKDIGKSRRKNKKPPRFDLEIPPSINNSYVRIPSRQSPKPDSTSTASYHKKNKDVTVASAPHLQQGCESQQPPPKDWVGPALCSSEPQETQTQEQCDAVDMGLRIERVWTGRMDPFIRYPVELDHRTRELVDLAFDDRYVNIGPFRDACFPMAMLDPAAFHQVLSNTILNRLSRRPENSSHESYESVKHHALAVKLVNQRIADLSSSTTEGFVGAVMGFACYHSYIGDHEGWGIHLDGLEQIIRLRGGLDSLSGLFRTNLSWCDLGGAYIGDHSPRFPVPQKYLPAFDTLTPCPPTSPQAAQLSDAWMKRFPHHVDLLNIMGDIRRFEADFKIIAIRTRRKIYSGGGFGTSYVLPLMHRLLSLPRLQLGDRDTESHIVEACRIACNLHLSEIRRLFGMGHIYSRVLTQKLRFSLENCPINWGDLELLRTWCLAMGGMESTSREQRTWYFQGMNKSGQSLDLDTWEEVEKELMEVLWFDEAHTPLFWEFVNGVDVYEKAASTHLDAYGRDHYVEPLLVSRNIFL